MLYDAVAPVGLEYSCPCLPSSPLRSVSWNEPSTCKAKVHVPISNLHGETPLYGKRLQGLPQSLQSSLVVADLLFSIPPRFNQCHYDSIVSHFVAKYRWMSISMMDPRQMTANSEQQIANICTDSHSLAPRFFHT